MEKTYQLTMKQMQRYTVLKQLLEGDINGTEVALKLGLSVRQVKRLKGRVKKMKKTPLRAFSGNLRFRVSLVKPLPLLEQPAA